MAHVISSKSQVKRQGQMNKGDFFKATPTSAARDDLRTAYSGDENHGPARKQKTSTAGEHTKGRRLSKGSGKTPVR